MSGMGRRNNVRLVGGFTLIELLMAMVILAVIVVAVARIFMEAQTSWEIGLKKAELNMTGRTLVDFVAQDLSRAVAEGPNGLLDQFAFGPAVGEVTFTTLEREPQTNNRVVRLVKYTYQPPPASTVRRQTQRWLPTSVYSNVAWDGLGAQDETNCVLAHDICEFWFDASAYPTVPSPTNLPIYVDVKCSVFRSADAARGYDPNLHKAMYESRAYLKLRNRYRYDAR